jgi:hypothetical protein
MDKMIFINEVEGLENISLDEVRGGLSLASYAEGCPNKEHQTVEPQNAIEFS